MIFLVVLGAYTLFVVAVLWASRRWARARADDPVPPRPPANPCTWCKPEPQEPCICAGKCGHVKCVGDYTSMAVLTAADMRMLDKWLREGCE